MASGENFEKLYKALNVAQKKAVDAIEGPVMVIAGPGTGKTQILALRIANILRKTDTSPDAILALAFTESAVHSMRSRLVSIIGPAAYKIAIFTFHGFANSIIERYPEEFPRIIGAAPATAVDQVGILTDIIEGRSKLANGLVILRPYGEPLFYLPGIQSAITELKRENIGPAECLALVKKEVKALAAVPESERVHQKGAHKGKVKSEFTEREKNVAKNQEFAAVYAAYEHELAKRRLYDFEDMLREVVQAFSNNADLLLRAQEQYQYILADEHQDANATQNALLELLTNFHTEPNLFIVGDEKQAIFRFQGASLDNFLYFKKLHPAATVISLEQNYRSTQAILDVAGGLIANNRVADANMRVSLRASGAVAGKKEKGTGGLDISLAEFSSPERELTFVARDIATRKEPDVAIIYRTNNDADGISRALRVAGVPHTIYSDKSLFADPAVANLVLLARTLATYGDDAVLGRVLYVDFLKCSPLDVFKLTRYASEKRVLIADVLASSKLLAAAGVADVEHFSGVATTLSALAIFSKNHGLTETLDQLVYHSGFIEHLLTAPAIVEHLAALESFMREAGQVVRGNAKATLADMVAFIDVVEEHGIGLGITVADADDRDGEPLVRLMTAHKSKGLEFQTVYIIGAQEGHWDGRRKRTQFKLPLPRAADTAEDFSLEDERRLFYVALTRAKRHVTISWAAADMGGKPKLPSQFVTELNPALVRHIDAVVLEKKLRQPEMSKMAGEATTAPLANRAFIRDLFKRQGWSVTALNNYLRCPWEYFFKNLVRLPDTKTIHQLYGTAVHAALAHFFRLFGEGELMSRKAFLDIFEFSLNRQQLSAKDRVASLVKGNKALGGWYDWYVKKGANPWPPQGLVEFDIRGVTVPVVVAESKDQPETLDVPLNGKLDRVEFLNDREVNVADFKTAKPKSRNEILGKTKSSKQNSAPDYFRQLIFYKLLLSLHEKGRRVMVSGDIDFVEPNGSGKYQKERFMPTDDDVVTLKQTIILASKDVWNLAFWNRICDDPDCEFCALRKKLGPDPM